MKLSASDVARIICDQRENILKTWMQKLEQKFSEAEEASYTDLRDSIPYFLEELAADIEAPSSAEKERTESKAKEHGEDRKANTDFSLDQVIQEFFLLRDVLLDTVEAAGEVPSTIYRRLVSSIDTGIHKSSEAYMDRTKELEATIKAEQELKLQRLGEAVEVARVGFFDWDILNDVLFFSPKMQEDWGIKAGASLSEALALIHPDDQARTMELIEETMKSGGHYFNQYRVQRPDGKEIWIQAQGQVTYDGAGTPQKFMGTSVDVTDERIFLQEMTEERSAAVSREAGIREIANSMPQIIWTARPDGFLDWYNERWYSYTGMALGTNWDDENSPMHPEDLPKIHKRWRESCKTGDPYEIEYRIRGRDGVYRWFVARALPVKDSSGKIARWIGSLTDIDALKTLQNELFSEKEVRERFVMALTHDLRTPLNAIKFGAGLVEKREAGNEKIQEAMRRILSNVDRAEKMSQDLLDANLLKAGEKIPLKKKDVDLKSLMEKTVHELRVVHGDHFQTDFEDGINGHWDPEALQRVVENLASNAMKYGDGGLVEIRTFKVEDSVEIAVLNHGNPISKIEQEKIFQNFQRTPGAIGSGKKGWGIGLGIVKGIIEAHGGRVVVESSATAGTEFKLILPLGAQRT